MEKLQVNQRVKDDLLGLGTILKIVNATDKKVFAYIVEFDETPPKDYNGGENPSLRLRSSLSVLPKRFSNEAYKNARTMKYEDFIKWWDEQV